MFGAFVPLLSFLAAPVADSAEGRALAFLSREVPRWSAENKCYSCHNNGDAARALYAAVRRGHLVPAKVLADTTAWLARPDRWDQNGGDQTVSDKGLARIQFGAAHVAALDANLLKERSALDRAADLVSEFQHKDGSWKVDADGTPGSPTTYGTCLATHMARRTLQRADPQRFRERVARADDWLRKVKVTGVLDAAAVLLALEGSDDPAARLQRRHCLELVRKGENKDGGWGPYVRSPPEPFDTAVVLLALIQFKDQEAYQPLLRRGRAVSLGRPAQGRQLARDDAPGGGGELRPAAFHNRVGHAGPAGDRALIPRVLRLCVVSTHRK